MSWSHIAAKCVVRGRNAKATILITEDMRQLCRRELWERKGLQESCHTSLGFARTLSIWFMAVLLRCPSKYVINDLTVIRPPLSCFRSSIYESRTGLTKSCMSYK